LYYPFTSFGTEIFNSLSQIQEELKYFRRFQGGWPVKAMIQQYLDNCTDKNTRDLRLEHEAEAADCDDGSTSQASNFNECQIQNRRGDNAEDAMNEHGG
jgi:hypothetical protein